MAVIGDIAGYQRLWITLISSTDMLISFWGWQTLICVISQINPSKKAYMENDPVMHNIRIVLSHK